MQIWFVFIALAIILDLTACAPKGGNARTAHPDLDARTRVYSADGTSFVECMGSGCDESAVKLMADYKPPTRAELDQFRKDWIYRLEHPRPLDPATCGQLPTIPWESWKIEEGGPSCNLPGYVGIGDMPAYWSRAEKMRRPQIKDTDLPIGKTQQGDHVALIYRLETGDLVSCDMMSGRDIPEGTCDLKYRTPKEYCIYSQTILRGH